VFGFPIHVSEHSGEKIMNGRDLARSLSDVNQKLRTKLTVDDVYNAMGGVPNYGEQIEIQRTLMLYVPSDGFSPGGSVWNSLVRQRSFDTASREKLWTALVAFYVDQGPISRVTSDIEDLTDVRVEERFLRNTREGNQLCPIERNACVRLSIWNIVYGLESKVGGRFQMQKDFHAKAADAFTITDRCFKQWIDAPPPDRIDYFPEFAAGCAQFLGVVRPDGAAQMMFYNVAHPLDVDLPSGTLVALPNYSYVVSSKGVVSRMGIVLRIWDARDADAAVMGPLQDKEAAVLSLTVSNT
jgi:hypothetical protein